ncbi:MAG: hypothetical protein GXP25_15240 [Planctomycetes bacterium]|nr:hypothetical protein [Planctomycetota bacterium]
MKIRTTALFLVAAIIAPLAMADTVVLNNGQRLTGKVSIRGDMVRVQDETGRVHSVNRALVSSIQRHDYYQRHSTRRRTTARTSTGNWRTRMEAKLNDRMSVDFDKTPIRDAVAFVRAQTGLNIIVSPDIPEDATITFSARDMTVRNILNWIGHFADAGYVAKNQALLIAPKEVILAEQSVETFNVRPYMLAIIDRPRRPNVLGEAPSGGTYGDALGLGGGGGTGGGIARDSRGRDLADVDLQERGKQFTKFLIHMTGRDSWSPQPAYIVPHLPRDE